MKKLVLGTGRSGLAVTSFLLKRGEIVVVSDQRDEDAVKASALWPKFAELQSQFSENLQWSLGGHPFSLLDECGEVIISPGISLHVDFLQEALRRKVRVSGEMEMAFTACPKPIVAVTGTNGKSTTCSVLGMMLGEQGVVGGNIGIPLLDQVQGLNDSVDWVVAEVSSFQLETVHAFRPKIGILTNISPDHLDHHKNLEEYRIAKARMFHQMGPEDVAIFCVDDKNASSVMDEAKSGSLPQWMEGFPLPSKTEPPRVLTYSTQQTVQNGVGVERDGEDVWVTKYSSGKPERLFKWDFPGLPGDAMMSNGLAATAAGLEMGLSLQKIQAGLRRFQPLRYRMELAGVVDGVSYINDSKATNIDSALASANAVAGSLAIIVGGKDKGVDYGQLAEGLKARNGRIFLIGEAAEPIAQSLRNVGFENLEESQTMGQALKMATKFLGTAGGTVLLAPACSSFDQFKSAEQRGQIFNEMVAELEKQRSSVG